MLLRGAHPALVSSVSLLLAPSVPRRSRRSHASTFERRRLFSLSLEPPPHLQPFSLFHTSLIVAIALSLHPYMHRLQLKSSSNPHDIDLDMELQCTAAAAASAGAY